MHLSWRAEASSGERILASFVCDAQHSRCDCERRDSRCCRLGRRLKGEWREIRALPGPDKLTRTRIRRALPRSDECLLTPREGLRKAIEYGSRYILDERNVMTAWCCDLEDLRREIGVLRNYEQVAAQ